MATIEQTHDAATAPLPQHMQALMRANEVRLARAELKRKIVAGDVSAAEVIRAPGFAADTMTIGELLVTQHRWGATRMRKFLAEIGMPETKTLGSFTDRQRRALSGML